MYMSGKSALAVSPVGRRYFGNHNGGRFCAVSPSLRLISLH